MKGYQIEIPKEAPNLLKIKELFSTMEEDHCYEINNNSYTVYVNAENEKEALYFAYEVVKEYQDELLKDIEKAIDRKRSEI